MVGLQWLVVLINMGVGIKVMVGGDGVVAVVRVGGGGREAGINGGGHHQ